MMELAALFAALILALIIPTALYDAAVHLWRRHRGP